MTVQTHISGQNLPPKLAEAARLRGLAKKLFEQAVGLCKDADGKKFVFNSYHAGFETDLCLGFTRLCMFPHLQKLSGETVEARAQDLLDTLHECGIDAEITIYVLRIIALIGAAKALSHEHHADVCTELARAIENMDAKPRPHESASGTESTVGFTDHWMGRIRKARGLSETEPPDGEVILRPRVIRPLDTRKSKFTDEPSRE